MSELVVFDITYVNHDLKPIREGLVVGGTERLMQMCIDRHWDTWRYLIKPDRSDYYRNSSLDICSEGVKSSLSMLKEFRSPDPFAELVSGRQKRLSTRHDYRWWKNWVPWSELTPEEYKMCYENYVFRVPKTMTALEQLALVS